MSIDVYALEYEKKELLKKIIQADYFIKKNKFQELSDGNQYLLKKQLKSMLEYFNILTTRIELNKQLN